MFSSKRLGALAAIAAGGLALGACGSPTAATPQVSVGQTGGGASQAAPTQAAAPVGTAPAAGSAAAVSIDGEYTVAAGEASTVRLAVANGALTVLDNAPAAGWQLVEDDRDYNGVELTYLRGADVVEFDAEIDDGRFETDVHTESLPIAGPVTYQVSDAGTVTVEVIGNRVALVGQDAAAGWAATVDERELAKGEVEIRFRSEATPGATADFAAEIDDGPLDTVIDTTTGWGGNR